MWWELYKSFFMGQLDVTSYESSNLMLAVGRSTKQELTSDMARDVRRFIM